jgi:Family of unknown function (DUF6221)
VTADTFQEPADPVLDFLSARHAEASAVATAACHDDGRSAIWLLRDHPADTVMIRKGSGGSPVVYDEGSPSDEEAAHIALWCPKRALAVVEAGRALVAAYERSVRAVGVGLSQDLRRPLLAHAAIWNDHPDYAAAAAS